MKKLELEREMKSREENKRNIIIRREIKKERWEGVREEVEGIVKETGAVVKVEKIKRIRRRN